MNCAASRSQHGFTYLSLLFVVAILGAGLGMAGELWSTRAQREKEEELLFVGRQFRTAIQSFSDAAPAGQPRRLPRTLQELVEDKRWPVTRRHLRRIYFDPMTGAPDWVLVAGAGGGIQGVHSRSSSRPFKQAGFDEDEESFENAKAVNQWTFSPSAMGAAEKASPRK